MEVLGADRPSVRVALLDRADPRGLAVQLRRVGRLALPALGHRLRPADLEDRPIPAGQGVQLRHAHRRRPADQRGLAGLVRLEARLDRRDPGGRLCPEGQVGLVGPA
jgi:hypothetical protein